MMGTSVEPAYIDRLHEDIQIACNRLEEIGHSSMVIVASEKDFVTLGSKQGRNYLDNCSNFIEEFCQYCRGDVAGKTGTKGKSKQIKNKSKTGAHGKTSNGKSNDGSVPEISNEEKAADDSDGDSVMSGLDNSDTEGGSKAKTKVIVVKAEPVEGADGDGRVMISCTSGGEDTDEDSNTWCFKVTDDQDEKKHTSKNKRQSRNKTFSCDQCDKVYKRMEDLKIHQRRHEGVFPFICEVCQRGFRSKKMLKIHMPVHSNTKPFQCDQCDKQYTRKEDLKIHMRKHSGETPYECDICMEGFIGRKQLKSHKATQHGQKPHKCGFCDKEYIHVEDLKSHETLHTGETPFVCSICDGQFRAKWQLRDHKKTHIYMSLVCETCGKSFARKHNLERHKMLHTNTYAGKCETCGKQFRDLSVLKRHLIRHDGSKPFCCSTCGKEFWNKYALGDHEKLHTGDRPFQCHICGKNFELRRYLHKHMGRAHKDHISSNKDLDESIAEENMKCEPVNSVPIHHLYRAQGNTVAGNAGTKYTAQKNASGTTIVYEVQKAAGSEEGILLKDRNPAADGEESKAENGLEGVLKEGGFQEMFIQASGLEEILKQAGGNVTIVLNE